VLADDGWVSSRAEGTSRYYRSDSRRTEQTTRLWSVVRDDVIATPYAQQDALRVQAVIRERRRHASEYFSSVAGQWDQVRAEVFGRAVDLRIALSLLDPESHVADLGCGGGQIASLLAPHVASVIAVDASAEMLEEARVHLASHPNCELRQGELERLPLESQSIDLAVLSLVLLYVPEPHRVVTEAVRTLRPGGRLVVIDMLPHDRDELARQMGHVWRGFSSPQVMAWFADAGLHRVRYSVLPADPQARGPALFAAVGFSSPEGGAHSLPNDTP
jgi:ArsR family transcriptional regulator